MNLVTVTTTQRMSTSYTASGRPSIAAAFRKIKLLVGGYLGISVFAMAAIVLMRHHSGGVIRVGDPVEVLDTAEPLTADGQLISGQGP